MQLKITKYGFNEINKHLKRMQRDIHKTFRPLVKAVCKTAEAKAKELAPSRTGKYKESIAALVKSALRGRLIASRPSIKENSKASPKGHGYLGGILEYGTAHMEAHPHLQKAIEYALKVHEKDIDRMMEGLLGG